MYTEENKYNRISSGEARTIANRLLSTNSSSELHIANLSYSLRLFENALSFARENIVVYCVDSVEVRANVLPDARTYTEYTFGGLLDGSLTGASADQSVVDTLTGSDSVNSNTLFFSKFDNVFLTRLSPHYEEVNRFIAELNKEQTDITARYAKLGERLKSQRVSVEYLEGMEDSIARSGKEAPQFQKYLDYLKCVVPATYYSFFNKLDSTPLKNYKALVLNSEIRALYGIENSIASKIQNVVGKDQLFDSYESSELLRTEFDVIHSDISSIVKETLKTSSPPLDRDIEAFVMACVINRLCKKNDVSVEFRLYTRSSALLRLASAFDGTVYDLKTVHPLFCPEKYGARSLDSQFSAAGWRISIVDTLERAYPRIQSILNPLLSNSIVSTKNILESIKAGSSSHITNALSNYAIILSSVKLAHAPEPSSEYSSGIRITDDGNPLNEGQRKRFFSTLREILQTPLVELWLDGEVKRIQDEYFLFATQKWSHEHTSYLYRVVNGYLIIRFRWGYMRPLFVFSSQEIVSIFNDTTEANTSDEESWILAKISVLEIQQRLQDISLTGKQSTDHLVREVQLLTALLLASMGQFKLAAAHASRSIPILDSVFKSKFENINTALVLRELLFLRHLCSRSSAFDDILYSGSTGKHFDRARRDLAFASLAQEHIRENIGEKDGTKISQLASHILKDDMRLPLASMCSYLDVHASWQKAVQQDNFIDEKRRLPGNNREISILRHQKHFLTLSVTLSQCRQLTSHVSGYSFIDKHFRVRINQVRMTVFIVLLVDRNSNVSDQYFRLKGSPNPNIVLECYDHDVWMKQLIKDSKKGQRVVSMNVFRPLSNILKSYEKYRESAEADKADLVELKKLLATEVQERLSQLENFRKRKKGARFRENGFYWNLTLQLEQLVKSHLSLLDGKKYDAKNTNI